MCFLHVNYICKSLAKQYIISITLSLNIQMDYFNILGDPIIYWSNLMSFIFEVSLKSVSMDFQKCASNIYLFRMSNLFQLFKTIVNLNNTIWRYICHLIFAVTCYILVVRKIVSPLLSSIFYCTHVVYNVYTFMFSLEPVSFNLQ